MSDTRRAGDDLTEQIRLARVELRNAEDEESEAREMRRYRERELDRLLEEADA
jgi:hypothetical protein